MHTPLSIAILFPLPIVPPLFFVCVPDCGWIYCEETPFAQLPADFECPQCGAGKKRFARFDAKTGKVQGAEVADLGTAATVAGGLIGLGVLFYVAQYASTL